MSTKRVAIEAVADRATASVHRCVEFLLKVPFVYLAASSLCHFLALFIIA